MGHRCLLFVTQTLGGLTAAALVCCIVPVPFTVQTSLGGGTSVVQGRLAEMLLPAELAFKIFMLVADKHKVTSIAPVSMGLALFVATLVGVYFNGGRLNPERSFDCCVKPQLHGYHWSQYFALPLKMFPDVDQSTR